MPALPSPGPGKRFGAKDMNVTAINKIFVPGTILSSALSALRHAIQEY